VVPQEVVGVDVRAADDPANAQLDETEVMSGSALAPALPAVHPLAAIGVLVRNEHPATGLEQILFGCEELVTGRQRQATDTLAGQIDHFGKIAHVPVLASAGRNSTSPGAQWVR
jgi:hypothetical protein